MKNYKSLWKIYEDVNHKLPFKVEWLHNTHKFIITIYKVKGDYSKPGDGFYFKEQHIHALVFGSKDDYLKGLAEYPHFKLIIKNECYLPPWF